MGALAGKNRDKSVTNHYKLDLLGFVDDLFGFLRAQRGVPSTRRAKNVSWAAGCWSCSSCFDLGRRMPLVFVVLVVFLFVLRSGRGNGCPVGQKFKQICNKSLQIGFVGIYTATEMEMRIPQIGRT